MRFRFPADSHFSELGWNSYPSCFHDSDRHPIYSRFLILGFFIRKKRGRPILVSPPLPERLK
ncbi:hypothetical protein LEP1GSC061_4252 [Leptospira wolffii serovar Khorat str. Khorat-H2]|nr:hypothetical protein LEP1GSC061_4252 [Leptospira wolffii serovar Khorat str. Khorat-H2]